MRLEDCSFSDLVDLCRFAQEWQTREFEMRAKSEREGDRIDCERHIEWLEHCIDETQDMIYRRFESIFGKPE